MSDSGTQLRAYLDQTVERVDVEDVMRRARARKPRTPQPLVHRRPTWIAAAAALIMLVSIGAVAAGAWLSRDEGVDDFVTRPDSGTGPPAWPNLLILGLAIGGGTIGLLAGGNALSDLIHRMRDRRSTMQTIETLELELAHLREDNARLGSAKRSLVMALVVVLIAVAGAGAWLIVDNAGTATEREITAFVEDYYTAWQDADATAVVSMMTEDATLTMVDGSVLSGESLVDFVNSNPDWNPELSGEIIIIERPPPGSPTWLVASPTLAPDYPSAGDVREIELFSMVREDGELLIKFHESWWGEKTR